MNLNDVMDAAGKNHLCEVAEAHKEHIDENYRHLSVNIDLDDGTRITCYPSEVVTQCCFGHDVSCMDESLGAFDCSIQKQIDKMRRFNENAIEKLEDKFDAETIMKSPCIAFVTTGDSKISAFNLCPMDICDKLNK